MNKIYLWIWANVWDMQENIKNAIKLLGKNIFNIKKSNIYKTKPFWETAQENFLNLVIFWETELSPENLLIFLKKTEQEIWRIHRYRWWPREIDIDILFYDDLVLETENLKIPHIWIPERDFVLKPMLDLEPNFIHPKLKKSVSELFEELNSENYTIIS